MYSTLCSRTIHSTTRTQPAVVSCARQPWCSKEPKDLANPPPKEQSTYRIDLPILGLSQCTRNRFRVALLVKPTQSVFLCTFLGTFYAVPFSPLNHQVCPVNLGNGLLFNERIVSHGREHHGIPGLVYENPRETCMSKTEAGATRQLSSVTKTP